MLITGNLLIPDANGLAHISHGWLELQNQRITQLRFSKPPRTPDLGSDTTLICPGFIDAHLHLPQFDVIGADGRTLLDWLDNVVFPAEAKWADPDFAGQMTENAARSLAAAGTTAIAAYATVHHDAAVAATQALHESGLRAAIGQVLMDRNAPADLTRPADQLIREASTHQPLGRVEPAITPRFAVSCTSELLAAAGKLAASNNQLIQTHLAEMPAECELVSELFDGRKYVDVYADTGLLTPKTILAHAVHLDNADRAKLAQAGSKVAHCPTANTFLQSGDMDLGSTLTAGIKLALGSDIAGGPDRSMPRVARAMIEAAKRHDGPNPPTPPTPAQAFCQITRTNADALGWTDCGRLEPGTWADLLILEPDINWQNAPDPLGALLYCWDDRWLKKTIAAGRIIYQAH